MENGGNLWQRYRGLPRNVVAIGLVSLLNDASSEIIYPLLPIFLASGLGASAGVIGAIEGLAESMSSLLKLFAGYLSDRLGKRKLLVVAGYSLASIVGRCLHLRARGPRCSQSVSRIASAKALERRRATR